MKDFLPTFTFGFLMAQLFPGAVAVLSLSGSFVTIVNRPAHGLVKLFTASGDLWFVNTRNTAVFALLSAAVGMFLHGLSWVTFAQMENKIGYGIRRFPFHRLHLLRQVLCAPFYILYESFQLLRAARLEHLWLEENVTKLDPKRFPNFSYLQDFYLYFAQFYVHMSYALLISLASFTVSVCVLGLGVLRVAFLFFLYFMTSAFFLIGRSQFMTLFIAELDLQKHVMPPDTTPVSVTLNNPLEVTLGANVDVNSR